MKARIERWRGGETLSLWAEAVSAAQSLTTGKTCQTAAGRRRAAKLAAVGQLGRACQALTSAGIHQPTPDVLDALRALHPAAAPPVLPPVLDDADTVAATVSQSDVRAAVLSFPP